MPNISLPPALYFDTDSGLLDLIPHLSQEPFVAIDTESNSLYAYREQVCLFQMTTRQGDFIVDPLGIHDMQPLAAILENPRIEKIFHAAEYDLMGIKRDFGFAINNVFDTMLAARICGYQQVGLNSMLQQYIGVGLDKKHQRDNWGMRPLPAESLLYAQMDTHFLPMLRNDLYDELVQQNRLGEAHDAFAELSYIEPAVQEFDPHGYWRIGRPNQLNRRQMAVLRELYLLREQIAEQRDSPPFKIITNEAMVEVARRSPQSRHDLTKIRGLSAMLARRFGNDVLAAIARGRDAKLPRPPRIVNNIEPLVMERYTALREWRKQRASQRGVDSDVIVSKNVLWVLAESAPQSLDAMEGIPGLGPWRLSRYGDELLEVLQAIP